MRVLTDHVVENDSCNNQVSLVVIDAPGQGNACHNYHMDWLPLDNGIDPRISNSIDIKFQNGPIKEFGINGITHEVLLAILIDRLRGFQAGTFACRDNAVALIHIEEALMWLQRRTRERIKRGVEGTNKI